MPDYRKESESYSIVRLENLNEQKFTRTSTKKAPRLACGYRTLIYYISLIRNLCSLHGLTYINRVGDLTFHLV